MAETDAQFNEREVCSARGPLGRHGPVALLVHEAREDGHFTLRVRCRHCKRLGYVDLDLSADADGVIWDKA